LRPDPRADADGDAVAYLRSLIPSGARSEGPFDLTRISTLLEALGAPQEDMSWVHVGGTAGKGSTATFLAAMLSAAGYRTGLHVSPHIVHERERAQIDGAPIGAQQLAELVDEIRSVAESADVRMSYFEALWLVTLLHFHRRDTTINVVEVGMGGALDATNIIAARHQILTCVGLEHTASLGRTKASILRVKQGIVKPGSHVVSGIREPALRGVLEARARDTGSTVAFAGRDFQIRGARQEFTETGLPSRVTFTYCDAQHTLSDLTIRLPGRGQAANAGLAVAMALRLADDRPLIDEGAIRAGLVTSRPPGRLDIVAEDPLTIFDAAHNPAKMRWLAAAMRDAFPDQRVIAVLRYAQRPDMWRTLATLAAFSEHIILTDSDHPGDMGAVPGYDAAAARQARAAFGASAVRSPHDALAQATRLARSRGPRYAVLATGSIYMLQQLYAARGTRLAGDERHATR
jgi:dihydrofolate synthase/folylpolyglutamate synthase